MMEWDLSDTAPEPTRRRSWLELILMLCFLVCLVVGMGSLAALLWLGTSNISADNSPPTLPGLRANRISPLLALNQLTGDPEAALALQAIRAGELETSWSILSYTTHISDDVRATLLQLLARRLRESSTLNGAEYDRLKTALRQLRTLALLSTSLDTTVRAQLLSQSTRDFLEIGEVDEALQSATQLQRLVQFAPDLLPAQRSQLLEPLRQSAQLLTDSDFQQRFLELTRNPFLQPTGNLLQARLNSLASPVTTSDAVGAARSQRQEAARALLARLRSSSSGPSTGLEMTSERAAAVDNLAQALVVEDQRMRQFTRQALDTTSEPRTRLGFLEALHEWTVLKARIAMGGFGMSIVPVWESDLSAIEQELETLVRDISLAVEEVMDTMDVPQEKASIRVEKFMWLALQLERDLFPNGSAPLIGNELNAAQGELSRQGFELALPLFLDTTQEEPEFLWSVK